MARLFAALLIVPALLAHHSTTEYDLKHPASASGVVTRFEWSNPHAHIFLDVAGDDGALEHWIIEIDSPNALGRMGWTKDIIKPGDRPDAVIHPDKNGTANGGVLAQSTGNQAEIVGMDETTIQIANDSCSAYYVLVVATAGGALPGPP